VLRDFYRDNYLKTGLNNKLFVNMSISEFHLPYYVIIVCEKMRDYETGIHMYRIIFTKKCKIFDTWLVGNLLYNLQFFINHVKEEDKSTFYSLFKEYADFLVANNYPLSDGKHEFMKGYEKCGIVVPSRFESVSVSKDKEECSKSKKILFYSGFAPFAWNYTYSTQHALGGSETALANLSKLFPSDFEIYVAGNVLEEKIANNDNGHTNVTYVNIQNLSNLVKTNAFHTVIVSRYVGFYDMYPETACYQSFIWGHDIVLLSSGSNMDVESILSKWSDKITGCICQTEWHKKLFVTNYPMLKDKMFVINNGIILDKFINKPVKIPNRFIYTSCSERGLERLLKLWPQIIEKMPDAELYISSYNRFPSNEFEFRLRDVIDRHEGVKHVGSLNKAQLYEMMASAEYWLYPTSFSETSCITAMEMLMSEVICIYYPLAGLNNTLGKYGIQVIPGTEIQSIMNLSEEKKAEMKINGKKYAMSCSWENRAKEWASVLGLNTDSELLFLQNLSKNEKRMFYLYETISMPQAHTNILKKISETFTPNVIYDIGASTLHWMKAAKNIWPNSEFCAFDAIEEAEKLYKSKNIKYNIGVISDQDNKIVKFYENKENPAGNSYYKEIGHPNSVNVYPENSYIERKSMTLETVVKRNNFLLPDLVKIDVQGAELDILKGGQTIINNAKYLIIELQNVEYNRGAPLENVTIEYLQSNGWEIVESKFSNNGPDADYLFINTNYRADKILNNDYIIKIINLERRSDRKTDMINKLSEKMVNNYEFFEAVDGNVLEPSVFIKNLFKNNDFNYRKGVIGCALSHYELWNNLINDDKYSYYVILEDDIEIVDNFNEYIEQSISIIQKQDIKYALIGGYQIKDKLTSADIISFDKITEQISSGTFGYIISKKACIKLVNYLNKNGINRAIDHSDLYTTCLDMYRINKYLVTTRAYQIHGETDTDIQLDYNCLNFNSMPNYTVSFVDWWSEEYCGGTFDNHNNYFTKLLSDFYDIKVVSPEENPDILFYSIFGNNHLNLNAKRKIFYTGEAIPQQPNADFNITFDNDNDNNCRLPLWLCYLNDEIIYDYTNKIQNKIEAPRKSKFCSIICQQDNVENTRSEIVNKLSKYKRVDCGGKFMNNIGYVVPRGINCSGKIEHNNNYKFVIAFENKDYPGYVTEKICDAYKSKCIPIYWGTKDVVKDFNPNTFINANDFVSMDELVEFIIMVDNNDKLYASYFKETIFSNKWLETFNDINKIFYKNLADRIIGKDTNLLNANTIEQINFLDYKIEYGIDENKIDITYKVVAHSLNKKFIEIPTDDVLRAELYGDPCCGVVKFIYVTNSEGIVTKFPDNKSITLDITRGLITTIIEPNYLTVYKSPYDKIRLGKDYDGGYIICDIPDIKYDFFLSGGILDDISFEEDFCSKYPDVKCLAHDGFIDNIDIKNNNITFIKKYIGDSDNQYFTNLHSLIDQYNNIFIKMDIEGGEIPWINSLSTEQIDKFAQIVMEFHFPFYEKECLVFEKLLTSHVLVHFHANNCCGTNIVKNIKIPNVFECTYIHKKYYNDKLILNTDNIPGTLDMKNVLDKDEIYIDYPPFVHPTSEHLSLSSIVDNILTDKNTRHSYLELYESIMHKNKFTAKNILEIGIDVGGSMKLWNDYFINATIYGLDINESPNFLNKYPRINTFKINAYTIDSVNYFVEKDIKFDFIIDDGPHTLESMIFTLIHYSKLLTPQGVLIIEDIQSIEWAYLFEKITNKYKENTHIYDLRENKGRYDDIVFTFTNSKIENIEFIDYNIEYGLDDNKINITHKVMSHSFNKEFIEIPTDDVLRAELYGDICWGVVKSIYITTKDGSVTKCKDNYPIILDWQGILIKKPNFLYKLSACLLIKNETENLNDWIEHYINEGVEHFFITSNNSTDGIDNFILNSEYKNMITLITDNSDINIYNDQLEHRNCLCKNFYNIIKNYTEWCILVDIDEFMYGKNGYTLSSFIDTLDEDIGCFYVYWNIFKPTVDSENKISDQFSLKKSCKRINLDLISDLSYEIKFASKFGKSIFRTSMLQDHTQLWIHKVFTSGKIITNYGNISNYNYDNVDDICWSESNYTKVNICLNHYAIRNKKDYNNKSCQLENKHRYPFVKGLLDICELDNKYIIEDDYILKHNCIQNNTIFKIGFYDNGLTERGTTTALYSYADYAEKYFKCKSIIFYNRTHYSNNNEVIDKFRKRFIVYDIDNFDEINNIIVEKNIKYFYNTCAGKRNCTELVKNCKNLIHAVFNIEPFGDIYAGISDYIVKKSKYPDIDAIPYMIDLPIHNENMRSELKLDDDDFIIGRIGGFYQFDVPEAHNAIIKFLNSLNDTNPVNDFISKINNSNNKNHTYKNETNRKVYFVFVNTNRFYEHPQIIYLDKIIDPYLKVKYINTCNCMIHARNDGETFGLAVGEFSSLNKPIITCRSNLDNCHLEILGDKAIIFDSTDSLITILENIQTISNSRDDWNTYKEYTPEKVMTQFKDVFLSNENMYL